MAVKGVSNAIVIIVYNVTNVFYNTFLSTVYDFYDVSVLEIDI